MARVYINENKIKAGLDGWFFSYASVPIPASPVKPVIVQPAPVDVRPRGPQTQLKRKVRI